MPNQFVAQPHTVARTAPSSVSTATHAMPSGSSLSVAQIFQQKGYVQWWNWPIGQSYGQNGEQGVDYAGPLNTAIHSIVGGKVVYSGYSGDASLGYVIQIATASGAVWHFQHMNSSMVRVGQSVNVGDTLGVSGGPPGQYSTGPHIEVRYSPTFNPALATGSGIGGAYWSDGKWQNPVGMINATAGSAPGTPVSSNGGGPFPGGSWNPLNGLFGAFSGLLGFQATSTSLLPSSASFQLPRVQLSPNADVTAVLVALDANLEIVNPFMVLNAQQDSILGATFTDPISWIEGFGYNVVADTTAWLIRSGLAFFGAYLIFKASEHFIDYGAVAQTAGQAVKLGASLA